MFRVGDKVVPNGFRAKGDKHCYGTNSIMIEWEKESKVVTVEGIDKGNYIHVTDGKHYFTYNPSELRIATEKESEVANNQKFGFKFDFDNNFYILKTHGGATFIASYKDKNGYIWGLSGDDEDDTYTYTYINQDDIKKIIASIPKR